LAISSFVNNGLVHNRQSVMIEIINRQRRHEVNSKEWRDFTGRVLEAIRYQDRAVTIVFVGNAAIKRLNQNFRGQNYPTDVLSFSTQAESFEIEDQSKLGDVVISLERAMVQAKESGLTFTNEVQQLILHGLLHLCGYDHETDQGEMNRLELKLRKRLGI
jgi:probable rRNA maturation factor